MHPPTRTLQEEAANIPGNTLHLSTREHERRDRILLTATRLIAIHGRAAITLPALAAAMHLTPRAVQKLFPCLDTILVEILHRHLQSIANTLAEIPHDAPRVQTLRRAAYIAATRTPFGGAPTDAHLLLTRDRHALPPDLAASLDSHRLSIALILTPPRPRPRNHPNPPRRPPTSNPPRSKPSSKPSPPPPPNCLAAHSPNPTTPRPTRTQNPLAPSHRSPAPARTESKHFFF